MLIFLDFLHSLITEIGEILVTPMLHSFKEAEKYASNNTGTEKKKINKSAENVRKNWYNHYCYYLNQCFEGMPTGWYKTEDIKVRDIISQTIKI